MKLSKNAYLKQTELLGLDMGFIWNVVLLRWWRNSYMGRSSYKMQIIWITSCRSKQSWRKWIPDKTGQGKRCVLAWSLEQQTDQMIVHGLGKHMEEKCLTHTQISKVLNQIAIHGRTVFNYGNLKTRSGTIGLVATVRFHFNDKRFKLWNIKIVWFLFPNKRYPLFFIFSISNPWRSVKLAWYCH